MLSKIHNYVKNLLLPCVLFSVVTGFFSAIFVTVFKVLTEYVVKASLFLYDAVRSEPLYLPLLVIGFAAIGLVASLILSFSHSCRGGGIPTSVAAIRGIVSFNWVKTIFLLPISALLTFLAGLPLGTEGPCVQMGSAVGDGVVKCFGNERNKVWRRYIMTGGASAGFSIATASPLSAIIFSIEEIHKHFSPILLSIVSFSVVSAQITARVLSSFGIGDLSFFHLPEMQALPHTMLYAPVIIGLASGISSICFTRLYHLSDRLMRLVLKKASLKIVIPALFATTAVVGFFFADAIGSGHSIVDALFEPGAKWYLLILIFLVRAVGMTVSNTSGATGGVFLPTLAFGAIIGAVCADAMIALGWIGKEHYILMVVLGVASFLGSTSRIPLTAAVFAIEALSGISNVVAIVIAVTVALLAVECSGLEDFTDAVIEAKLHKITKGKKLITIEAPLTVAEDSFVVGKEIRDILWPNSCVVVSYNPTAHKRETFGIMEGDVITVRYVTYDLDTSVRELTDLVGEQSDHVIRMMHPFVESDA